MELMINEYMRAWSDAQLTEYMETGRQLRAAIARAAELCVNAQRSLDHLRRIDAFNDYQEEILVTERVSPYAGYAPLSFVRMALGRQKINAQEFAHSDLILNRTDYMRELGRLYSLRLAMWTVFFIAVFIVGFFLHRTLRDIAAAMTRVHDNLRSLSRREWSIADLVPSHYVELDEISDAANQMKHVIRDHIARLEEHARLERQLALERLENERKERMLVEAKAAALKAQVNPHFLFNTLNLIGKSAFLQEPELAMELIEATAKILRYSLDSGNRRVTVQEEIDIVTTYLYLQKNRFGDALSYAVEVDEDLWNCPTQPMLMQPLVENCFKHGMGDRRDLAVRIAVRRVGDALEIAIRDNGRGFPAASERTGGTGLDNIRDRLRLEYGIDEPVRIDSVPGEYAEVTLTIPVEREGKIR